MLKTVKTKLPITSINLQTKRNVIIKYNVLCRREFWDIKFLHILNIFFNHKKFDVKKKHITSNFKWKKVSKNLLICENLESVPSISYLLKIIKLSCFPSQKSINYDYHENWLN